METEPANITLEDMAAQLGGGAEPTPAPTTDPAPATDPTPAPAANPAPTVTDPAPVTDPANPEPAPAVTEPVTQQLVQNKANEAFANMRIQNKQMAETLKGVAGILGIQDTIDDQAIMTALQHKVLESQAQEQHVPVELLQEVQYLKQRDQQHTAIQRQSTVEQGFQDLKTKYNLDDQALNQFAKELIQNNNNPLEKDVDLMKEYRNMHFDDLIQDAINKAVANEQSRAAAATQTSTNPGSQQANAAAPGAPAKINSVRDLASWFNDQNNK